LSASKAVIQIHGSWAFLSGQAADARLRHGGVQLVEPSCASGFVPTLRDWGDSPE